MQPIEMSFGSLNHWKVLCKNQGPNSKDERVINLFSPFRDRQADIVAYKIMYAIKRDFLGFMGPLGRLPAKKNLYAKQTETLWLIEVMYAIKRVL